jgi:hypothetical protein
LEKTESTGYWRVNNSPTISRFLEETRLMHQRSCYLQSLHQFTSLSKTTGNDTAESMSEKQAGDHASPQKVGWLSSAVSTPREVEREGRGERAATRRDGGNKRMQTAVLQATSEHARRISRHCHISDRGPQPRKQTQQQPSTQKHERTGDRRIGSSKEPGARARKNSPGQQ